MGGSEYFKLFGNIGNNQPKVRPGETMPTYKAISEAIESGLVSSVHDISDGGLAIALVECAFPTGIGVDVDFHSFNARLIMKMRFCFLRAREGLW